MAVVSSPELVWLFWFRFFPFRVKSVAFSRSRLTYNRVQRRNVPSGVTFWGNILKFARVSRADGGGEDAR